VQHQAALPTVSFPHAHAPGSSLPHVTLNAASFLPLPQLQYWHSAAAPHLLNRRRSSIRLAGVAYSTLGAGRLSRAIAPTLTRSLGITERKRPPITCSAIGRQFEWAAV
jgi:hypothetical protein